VAPVSQDVLDLAAPEAAHILRSLPVRLNWINCSAPVHPDSCEAPDLPTDVSIRVLPRALPPASKSALGMAMWAESGSSAAVFYDRAIAIRKPGLFLAQILGRAVAHEVVHLLLGTTSHDELGLMKSEWTSGDLHFDSGGGLELSQAGKAAIRSAVEQRTAGAEGSDKRAALGFVAKPRAAGPLQ